MGELGGPSFLSVPVPFLGPLRLFHMSILVPGDWGPAIPIPIHHLEGMGTLKKHRNQGTLLNQRV